MARGYLIILSGPSGVGKDTIINSWQTINPLIYKVITCTTRAMREGEQHQIDYLFMSTDEFEEKIKENYFVEHTQVYDHYYGIPKISILNALEQGKWVILKIDVQGAFKMMKIFPEAFTLFLMPPNLKELEDRIFKRAKDTPEQIQKRLLKAQEEINLSQHYQYIIVNESIIDTIHKLEEIFNNLDLEEFKNIK